MEPRSIGHSINTTNTTISNREWILDEMTSMKNEEYGANAATGGGADPMAFSHAWHQAVIEDFADALQSRRDPTITGRSALAVHALIDAINLSDKTGQRVTVEANDD